MRHARRSDPFETYIFEVWRRNASTDGDGRPLTPAFGKYAEGILGNLQAIDEKDMIWGVLDLTPDARRASLHDFSIQLESTDLLKSFRNDDGSPAGTGLVWSIKGTPDGHSLITHTSAYVDRVRVPPAEVEAG